MLYQHEQDECVLTKKKIASTFAVVMLPSLAVFGQASELEPR